MPHMHRYSLDARPKLRVPLLGCAKPNKVELRFFLWLVAAAQGNPRSCEPDWCHGSHCLEPSEEWRPGGVPSWCQRMIHFRILRNRCSIKLPWGMPSSKANLERHNCLVSCLLRSPKLQCGRSRVLLRG